MSNKFQEMANLLLEKPRHFLFGVWGECLNVNGHRKWLFCPLSTTAIESGLNRRKLIDAIKKDEKLDDWTNTKTLVVSHLESKGFAKNKMVAFVKAWDFDPTKVFPLKEGDLWVVDLLQFASWFADNYDLEISFEDKDNEKVENLICQEFGKTLRQSGII